MRIGIYDPYLDDLGGGEKYMMTIAECLSKEHRVDIFWDRKTDLEAVTQRFSLDLSKTTIVSNIFSSRYSSLHRFFASKKYDVILFLSDGSIPFVASKKLFIHIQQPLDAMQANSLVSKIKLSRVNAFFCNSHYTRSFIEKKFPVKSRVVYPPVALHPKNIKKENCILHVGRFRVMDPITHAGDYKKQHVMIDVFKEMIDKGLKNWEFVLAVSVLEKDKEQFEKMKHTTKKYPIRFLVNQTNDKLWDIYSKAKIYWHASGYGEDLAEHPEFAEHFGISTVEAMGAGAVPVVINAGGQKEIVKEGENGFLWNSLEELQEKSVQLIHNPKLLENLSKSAEKTAQKFSGNRFCEEVHKLMQ